MNETEQMTETNQVQGTLLALLCGVLFAERVVDRCASNACVAEEHPRAAAALGALALHAQASATSVQRLWAMAVQSSPLPSVTMLPPSLESSLNLSNAIERSADLVRCLTDVGDDPVRAFCDEWLTRRYALTWELKEALGDRRASAPSKGAA